MNELTHFVDVNPGISFVIVVGGISAVFWITQMIGVLLRGWPPKGTQNNDESTDGETE